MTTRIDFVPYPPTSFPFRDLLVLEQMSFGPGDRVCEIGVGSGATTARLARMAGSVVGFEISGATVEALRYLESRYSNLSFVVGDVTRAETTLAHAGKFTRVIACDTLEHVTDPAAFFKAAARLLAPGGELLVTFPNEPLEKMHGITRFDDSASLVEIARRAGIAECRVGAAVLAPAAERVADVLGWAPLRLVRKALRRGSYKRVDETPPSSTGPGSDMAPAFAENTRRSPQTFDETHFMKKLDTWKKVAPLVNLYWYGVLKLMERDGPSFLIDWDFTSAPFTDCQVFLSGKKGARGDGAS